MRNRKYWKCTLCAVLAASMVFGSPAMMQPAVAYADEAESAVTDDSVQETEQDAVSDNDIVEDVTEEPEVTDAEEPATPEEPSETTEEVTEGTTEETGNEIIDSERMPAADVDKNAKLSTVVSDTYLLEAMASAMTKSKDSVTVGETIDYTGTMDLSKYANADKIQSFVGIGYAQNATEFNLGNCTGVNTIAAEEFRNCKMTKLVLPDSITDIGSNAFAACKNLESVSTLVDGVQKADTLPSKLQMVGGNAFNDCTVLTTIIIPDTIAANAMENAAALFLGCENLQNVTIGTGLTVLPDSAFAQAGVKAGELVIEFKEGSRLSRIKSQAFQSSAVKTMDLSNCTGLDSIDGSAFDASQIQTVILPESLADGKTMKWGGTVFANTESLEALYAENSSVTNKITIPDYVIVKTDSTGIFKKSRITNVSIPASWELIPGETFSEAGELTSVKVAANSKITSVGTQAFYKATELTDVEFLKNCKNLSVIGDSAFVNTEKITKVELPGTVVTVGEQAFAELLENVNDEICKDSALESFVWEEDTKGAARTLGKEALFGRTSLVSVTLPENNFGAETFVLGEGVFAHDRALETVKAGTNESVVPSHTTSIGNQAFYKCAIPAMTVEPSSDLKEPVSLGENVFEECQKLTKAKLPDNMKILPLGTFFNTSISELTIGGDTPNVIKSDTLTKIGDYALFGCQIKTLDLSGCPKLEEIANWAFASIDNQKDGSARKRNKIASKPTLLETVILPDRLNNTKENKLFISSGVFEAAYNFKTLVTKSEEIMIPPAGLVHIPEYVVMDNMHTINGNYGTVGIGEATFASTAVKNIILPASWTGTLPKNAFYDCNNIENVDFLNDTNLKGLGEMAFAYCAGLTTINLKENRSITEIGKKCFYYCDSLTSTKQKPMTLPSSIQKICEEAFMLGKGSDGFQYLDLSGYENLKDIERKAFYEDDCLTEVVWADNATEMKDSIFENASALKTIDFNGAEKIKSYTFKNCPELCLTGTDMDGITEIGSSAFEKDYGLGTVKFGPQLTKISGNAFKEAAKWDDSKNMQDTKLAFDFTNASGLTTIDNSAFENSAVTAIDLTGARQLTEIKNYTFKGCELLKEATFGQKVEYINDNALSGCPVLTNVNIYSKTTISQKVFEGTAGNNKITNYNVNLQVKPVNDTIRIALDQTVDFPYYVHMKNELKDSQEAVNTSPFTYVYAGDSSKKVPESERTDMYLAVSGAISEGYFINTAQGGNENLVSGTYQDKDGETVSLFDRSEHFRKVSNNKEVDVFQVTGRRKASYPLTVGCQVVFKFDNGTVKVKNFYTTYTVEVTDADYAVGLYPWENGRRGTLIAPDSTYDIHAENRNGKEFAYDMEYAFEGAVDNTGIEDYNIVVVSKNKDILYPAKRGGGNEGEADGIYQTDLTEANPNNQKIWLVPKKCGTATIEVYPSAYYGTEKAKDYVHRYKFEVNADITQITLVESAEKNARNLSGLSLFSGQSQQLFLKVKTGLNEELIVTNNQQLQGYTDNVITFTTADDKGVTVNDDVITVNNNFQITAANDGDTAIARKLTAVAKKSNGNETRSGQINVTAKPSVTKEKSYRANLYGTYANNAYGSAVASGAKVNFQADANNNRQMLYYDMKYVESGEAALDKNVIVVSSNPAVLYPGRDQNDHSAKTTGICTTTVAANSTNKADQKFCLIPASIGTATVTVYPSDHGPGTPECERFAVTFTYTVNADIREIKLGLPQGDNTLSPKQTMKITLEIRNCLDQNVKIENMADLAKYTNNTVTFTSNNTKLLTVDNNGVATAIATEDGRTEVEVTAQAVTSQNKEVKGSVRIGVKPLEIKTGENYQDESGTANVTVTKVGTKNEKGEVTYDGPVNKTAATVNIPKTVRINGVVYTITAIAPNAFKGNTAVKTVKIPTGITEIGANAFNGCTALKKITVGSDVTKIGDSAFSGCSALTSITIGKKVTEIGKKAFYNCKKLKKITIKSKVLTTVGKQAFKNIHKKATIKAPKAVHDLLKKKGQAKTVKIK